MNTLGHFLPGLRVGTGTGEATTALIRGFAACGVAQVVISSGVIELPDDLRRDVKVSHVRGVGRGKLTYPMVTHSTLSGVRLLLTHGGWNLPPIVAARRARRAATPYVIRTTGVYDRNVFARHKTRKRLWLTAFERGYITNAGAIHCFASEEYEDLTSALDGTPPPHLSTPNAVEMPPVEWEGFDSDYVLWLGRFDLEVKGLDLLLKALARLPASQRPHLRLHGRGPAQGKAAAAALAQQLDLTGWVTIGDALLDDAKWQALSEARAFIFPSRWEGFGMALAEAVGVGVPTVSTPVALGRYLAERGAVRLAQPTQEALAEGMMFLMSSEARAMSTRGRQVVEEDFSPRMVAGKWLAALRHHALL